MSSPRRRVMVAALALLLAGCGDRNLVLSVDLLSFLDAGLTESAVGPLPAVPGGLATGEEALVDDHPIQLFEGLGDAATVRSVTLTLRALAADSTGSGSDTVRVYLSGADEAPRSRPPVLTRVVSFTPGLTDTVEASLEGSTELADLFTRKQVRLSVTNSLRGPSSGADLNGHVRLDQLHALVIAGRKPL
jgi:hypothetical protein